MNNFFYRNFAFEFCTDMTEILTQTKQENSENQEVCASVDESNPPCYRQVLLESHLQSAKNHPQLYPPDLRDAIVSILYHPTMPPSNPLRYDL